MNKAKAKTLVSALIEDGFEPTISVDGTDYIIAVKTIGVTTTQVATVESSLNVTASIKYVLFN